MKVKIFLIRHLGSKDNKRDLFSGSRNVDLTEEAKTKLEGFAAKFNSYDLGRIYSSPLKRVRVLAEAILEQHPESQLVVEPRLRERSYGWLEGHSKHWWATYCYPLFKLWHRSFYIPPPGGESLYQVKIRVNEFIDELLTVVSKEKKNVLIACHGNSLRPIRQRFEGLSNWEMSKIETSLGQSFEYEVEV